MNQNKEIITDLLLSTRRPGINNLIDYMDECGFYQAPCSTQYHLCYEGGLAEHVLNVYKIMADLADALYPYYKEEHIDSIILCALLHDLGKTGQYGKVNYIPNMLKGRATKANPAPVPVQSEAKPFKSNPDLLYVDHEIRSIVIASKYIDLTEDESWAIQMHNGLYGTFKYQIQGKETPLYLLIHFADMWASRILEGGVLDEKVSSSEC